MIGEILFVKFLLWVATKLKEEQTSEGKSKSTFANLLTFLSQHTSEVVIIVSLVFCAFYVMKSYSIEINSNYIIRNRDWMGKALLIFTALTFLWIEKEFEAGTNKAARNMIIFFALFFISYSVSCAVDRIENTVNIPDRNTVVVLQNDTIRTNPKYYYVGRTNKFIFFYDTEKERADVIPQNLVLRMSFGYQKP